MYVNMYLFRNIYKWIDMYLHILIYVYTSFHIYVSTYTYTFKLKGNKAGYSEIPTHDVEEGHSHSSSHHGIDICINANT